MNPKTLGRLSLCAAVLALTACGGGHKNLYYYGGYPDTVYEGLKNDDTSLGKQTEKMEKYFAEAANKKNECRPGCARPFGTAAFPVRETKRARSANLKKRKGCFPNRAYLWTS